VKYLGKKEKDKELNSPGPNVKDNLTAFVDEVSSRVGSSGARLPIAGVMPQSVHRDFALSCARKIMCFSGNGCGTCPACSAWSKTEHPDLLLFGNLGEPPGIRDCRKLWEELSLKPIASRKRVAVIHSAHRLSLPAANSLLKITEETPSTGALILLLEEDVLIPTLRSRLRIFQFREGERPGSDGRPVPSGIFEFVKWIGKTRKVDPKVLAVEIQCWVEHFLSREDPSRASDLDTIRLLAEKGKLTTPMVQDLVLSSLEGEVRFEELLGDNW
jgi:DNA polymerase-3 subunit delta'